MSFRKFGVPDFGVLIVRILLFTVFWGPYSKDPTIDLLLGSLIEK